MNAPAPRCAYFSASSPSKKKHPLNNLSKSHCACGTCLHITIKRDVFRFFFVVFFPSARPHISLAYIMLMILSLLNTFSAPASKTLAYQRMERALQKPPNCPSCVAPRGHPGRVFAYSLRRQAFATHLPAINHTHTHTLKSRAL